MPLENGDVFLLLHRRLSEAMNDESELFGEGRLRPILRRDAKASLRATIRERILSEVRRSRAGASPARRHDPRRS